MFDFRKASTVSPILVSIMASVAMLSLSAYAMNDIVCSAPPHCTIKIGKTLSAPPTLSFVLA